MQKFLNDSELALKGARATIDGQESMIIPVQQIFGRYEAEVASLKRLSKRLSAASKTSSFSNTTATKLRLSEQATLINQVKNTISKK